MRALVFALHDASVVVLYIDSHFLQNVRIGRRIDGVFFQFPFLSIVLYGTIHFMKLYIIKHPNTNHTGLTSHETDDFVFSVETEHPDETIKEIISLGAFSTFDEVEAVFLDVMPNTMLLIVRDFIWNEFKEQGIVEEGRVTAR